MNEGEDEGEVSGPRAWVILLGTVVAAAVVIGGILGWQAWQNRGDDEADAPATTAADASAPPDAEDPGDNLLFRRTTDSGIEVRARRMDGLGGGGVVIRAGRAVGGIVPATSAVPTTTAADGEDTDGNGLPDFCDIVGDLTAWAIGDETIVQGGAPWTKAAPPDLAPSLMWDGQSGVDTIIGVVLQVADDVAMVRLTGPGGAVDEMEPVEGAVVLAIGVPAEFAENPFDGRPGQGGGSQFVVTAHHAGGTTSRASADGMMRGHPAWGGDPACNPEGGEFVPAPVPVATLPEPGPEQPADPAAARAEIEANFSAVYGRNETGEDRGRLIDDNYGFDEVMEQVDDNGFSDEADASTVEIDELVFTSTTDAVFSYVLTTRASEFPGQLGRARLLDGIWKITRATLCQDLSKAGGICPP